MIALMHPPSRSYIDPWTGQIFGDGGIDYYLHPKLIPDPLVGGVKGGVIMSKLGNETAKYAKNTSPFSVDLALDLLFERAELGRATWKLMWVWSSPSRSKMVVLRLRSYCKRHTMTLRYPEVRTPASIMKSAPENYWSIQHQMNEKHWTHTCTWARDYTHAVNVQLNFKNC